METPPPIARLYREGGGNRTPEVALFAQVGSPSKVGGRGFEARHELGEVEPGPAEDELSPPRVPASTRTDGVQHWRSNGASQNSPSLEGLADTPLAAGLRFWGLALVRSATVGIFASCSGEYAPNIFGWKSQDEQGATKMAQIIREARNEVLSLLFFTVLISTTFII